MVSLKTTRSSVLHFHLLTVLAGMLLLAGKFAAYFITGSNAILTDAFESIVNVVAGLFAYYSLWLAAKPHDLDHPYGHGKIEFISAAIEGTLIVIAGCTIFGKAVYNFFEPNSVGHLDIGLVIITIAGVANYAMGVMLVKKGKEKNSETLKANGNHLKSDAYSTVGLLVGIVLILVTGKTWMDNLMALAFSSFIAYNGIRILRNSIAGIMDEADFDLLDRILKSVNRQRQPDWIDIHNLRIIKYGARLHVDCHVTLPWYYTVQQAHDAVKHIEDIMNHELEMVEVFIHTDPCIPTSCKHCQVQDCPVRHEPFSQRIEWDVSTALQNKKHGV